MAVRNKVFIPNEIYFITFTILGWKKVFLKINTVIWSISGLIILKKNMIIEYMVM